MILKGFLARSWLKAGIAAPYVLGKFVFQLQGFSVPRNKTPSLLSPDLVIESDGTPVSGRFGDVYFSRADGLEETRHVFINGVGGPADWATQEELTIAETGFGTGLNFLLTWSEWKKVAPPDAHLHYISLEGFPLKKSQLESALESFPSLTAEAKELLATYPLSIPGFHRRIFDGGRVSLTLMFGEAAEVLSQLTACVDAWYLDGFAPSKNPEMWRSEVLEQIARLSRPGTRLATFTAAGFVRRGLESLGFEMAKTPGFGRKRECLRGRFTAEEATESYEKPWFRAPKPLGRRKKIALIGGGVAGCAAAYVLNRADCEPVIIEKRDALAQEASGNPAGILSPRLTIGDTPQGRFYLASFLHSVGVYEKHLSKKQDIWLEPRGILTVARDADERQRQERLVEEHAFPEEFARLLDARQAEDLSGLPAPLGGIWYGLSGAIRPENVCRALAEGVEVVTGEAHRLERHDDRWQIFSRQGNLLTEADAVVLTNGPLAADFLADCPLTIFANRGQIAFLPAQDRPKVPFSFGGYLTPQFDSMQVLGSTYDRWRDAHDTSWEAVTESHHLRCLDILAKHHPEHRKRYGENPPLNGRASLRAVTSDRMPLVGPLPIAAAYENDYADLRHGRRHKTYPPATYAKNLYVLAGLGSRGFQTALPSAEVLTAMITGTHMPFNRAVIEALHPARFILHGLKRGKKANS